jgi:hypothetical protein
MEMNAMKKRPRNPGIGRRALLQALGLGGVASLLMPSLGGRRVHAGGTSPPRRLLIFYTLHGTVYDTWRMRPSGEPDNADWEFDLGGLGQEAFSEILAPLYDVRDRLLILDGLSMASAEGDVLTNEHSRGQAHSLTCVPVLPSGNDVVGGGPSVDQLIAAEIRRPELFASLELGVGWGSPSVIYQGPGERLPVENNPIAVFDRLFPGGASTGEPTDDDRVRAAQRSVLDRTVAEFEAALPYLSPADRARLELHRDLVRDLERRLDELASISCDRPDAPMPLPPGDMPVPFYEAGKDAMFRLATAALACDVTRVVSIQMSQLFNEQIGAEAGDVHQDFAHQTAASPGHEMMTNYHRLHATQFAELVSMLASVPDAGGGSLLDSTAVVWCNELATGSHSFLRWPVVIAGEAGGAFRTGRYVHWAPSIPTPNEHPDWQGVEPEIGPPHQKLWVSVSRAMGVDVDSVGSTEIETVDGIDIDLTGPLDRLA